jgi:hypothetical protein
MLAEQYKGFTLRNEHDGVSLYKDGEYVDSRDTLDGVKEAIDNGEYDDLDDTPVAASILKKYSYRGCNIAEMENGKFDMTDEVNNEGIGFATSLEAAQIEIDDYVADNLDAPMANDKRLLALN